jgi:heat shock protein HslJ
MKYVTLLVIALALVASACTSVQAGGGELTVPSRWRLVSFVEEGSEIPVVEGSTVTLELAEDGQLGGSGGCNSYGAAYEIDGKTLKVEEVISTLMACLDDQVMEQESQYFAAIHSATGFEVSSDGLTISYEGGQLNFVKQ